MLKDVKVCKHTRAHMPIRSIHIHTHKSAHAQITQANIKESPFLWPPWTWPSCCCFQPQRLRVWRSPKAQMTGGRGGASVSESVSE